MRIAAEPVAADVVTATTDVLVKALRALGQAGHPDAASRLAAKAWWALRDQHPRQAERIIGAMHYLARLPAEPGAHPTEAPASLSTPLEEA
jgi:hypothetical protein